MSRLYVKMFQLLSHIKKMYLNYFGGKTDGGEIAGGEIEVNQNLCLFRIENYKCVIIN